jgi:hypothetical protein
MLFGNSITIEPVFMNTNPPTYKLWWLSKADRKRHEERHEKRQGV